MSPSQIVVEGTLKPDGSLELDERPKLPPGRVQVILTALRGTEQASEDVWTVLERIWAERSALGLQGRTREEIDADVQALRDELEEHARGVERLQEEAQGAAEQPPC